MSKLCQFICIDTLFSTKLLHALHFMTQDAAPSMEKDYEEVVYLLESDVAEAKEKQSSILVCRVEHGLI